MRAQGALEYLIIIAAVLGISAVVVLFVGGAFMGSSGGADLSKCRLAAANCQKDMATGLSSTCPYCDTSCVDSSGKDLLDKTPGCGFACQQCKKGTAPSGSAQGGSVAYWKLDEGYGITAIDGVGSTSGTFLGETFVDGSLINNPPRVSGKYGGALDFNGYTFDGAKGYVRASSSSTLDTAALTISTWVYPKNLLPFGGYALGVVSNGDYFTNGWRFILETGTGRVYWQFKATDGTGNSIWSPTGVSVNTWTHIAVTYDWTTATIYINGVPAVTQTFSKTLSYAGWHDIRIGASDYYFNGTIDSVRVWNRALSQLEIQADKDSSRPLNRTVADWEFEEGAGQYANDSHIWVAGKSGTALSFDGVNDYADLGSSPSLNFVNYTIEGWAKPASSGVAGRHLVERGAVGGSGYLIQFWNNDNIYFYQSVAGNYYAVSQATPFAHDSLFHYFAATFTYDGATSTLSMFYDGAQKGSRSAAGAPDLPLASDTLKLGFGTFNGALDEVKIYNYALPASEILAHYNALK